MGNPTWMYRRTGDGALLARIFDADEIPDGEGWRDTPATPAPAAPAAPAAPDPLDAMSKAALEAYALERFGVDLDRRRTLKALRAQIREMAAGDREESHGDDRA